MTLSPLSRIVFCLIFASAASMSLRAQDAVIPAQRITEIEAMLPGHNLALAPPCSDRAAWAPLKGAFAEQIEKAKSLVGKPFPAWSDDDYLDYFKTGSRELGQKMISARTSWLAPLVLAECAEWNGEYQKTIAMVLRELATEKSWALPAHDVDQGYLTGKRYFVELASADIANTLATALYLLGDKVPAADRELVLSALETRVFKPMRVSYATGKGQTWLRVESNWNAVCLAGVTGAALAVLPEEHDRAFFVAAAEYYQQFYLKSFPADGFEVEGIGYWNYGFANYAVLREELWRATSGKIDLFQNERVPKAARFGVDFQMLPGVMAYFSDAHFGEQPMPALSQYVSRTFGLRVSSATRKSGQESNFAFRLISEFPSKSALAEPGADPADSDLRTFYPVAGVLVARPRDQHSLAATIKAMGNGPHSHNDIGSYAIGLRQGQPMGEPGGPAFYTSQTFSKDRYLSKLLNSYGHPVPVVDGKLQKDAQTVKAPIIAKSFSPERDEISIDMTAAYDVPELRQLVRTLTLTRTKERSVTIHDAYALQTPVQVDEALITVGDWKKIDNTTLQFSQGGSTVNVRIKCPVPYTLKPERIDEYGRPFTRIGIAATLSDGQSIDFVITPMEK